jgi:hypothetical protein
MTSEELENPLRDLDNLSQEEYHEPAADVALGPEEKWRKLDLVWKRS